MKIDKFESFNSNGLKLPKKIVDKLIKLPEQGMGYQIIDLKLKDGTILKRKKVVNSTYLLEPKDVQKSDIIDVELSQ